MNWKSTALASGVTVAGMWVASYAPTGGPDVASNAPTVASTEAASVEIQREARRLHERLERVPTYRQPSRNPFSFAGARRAPARPAEPPALIEEPAALQAPQPPTFLVSLAGIAEDTVDGVLVRTAVIATPQAVLLVKVGDVVGDLYTVTAIDAGSAELTRLDDGAAVRLALRP